MTAGESNPEHFEQQHNLQLELSKQSQKDDDLRAESESIASALQGNENEAELDARSSDLEKAATQATRGKHDPVTRIVTAVDWSGE